MKPSERGVLKSYMEDIGIENIQRGTDASGYAYIDEKGETNIFKKDITFRQIVRETREWQELDMPRIFIGHTRAYTQGSPKDNENNHPVRMGKFTIVHNGIIWNDYELSIEYGLKRNALVDSEAIVSLIHKMKTDNPNVDVPSVLQNSLDKLSGSHACAMLSQDEPDKLYLWRSSSPLYVAFVQELDTIFFSSMSVSFPRFFNGLEYKVGSVKDENIVVFELKDGIIDNETYKFEAQDAWGYWRYGYHAYNHNASGRHNLNGDLGTYGLK